MTQVMFIHASLQEAPVFNSKGRGDEDGDDQDEDEEEEEDDDLRVGELT